MVEPEAARGKNPGSIQRPIRNTGVGSRTHVAWTPESFCYGEKESGYDSLPYSDGRSGHLEPKGRKCKAGLKLVGIIGCTRFGVCRYGLEAWKPWV